MTHARFEELRRLANHARHLAFELDDPGLHAVADAVVAMMRRLEKGWREL